MELSHNARHIIRPLILALVLVAAAGCGSTATSSTGSSPSVATASPSPLPVSSSATSGETPTATTPGPSRSTPSVDASAAAQSALRLFERVPRNPTDPSAGYMWMPATAAADHLSQAVNARLAMLRSSGYFGDQACGVDYITGTQNGLTSAPKVVSTHINADGSATIVIQRSATPPPANLTAVMSYQNGVWLATDLASGDGPSASIFSAKPNC